MALLNRCRALFTATPDFRPPQPLATPCPHGHLDIADLTNFPTGRVFGMSSILRIRWVIAPKTAPRPLINCNRCNGLKAYHSSGKFRVNANGKRIDAWLIYH
ncbi:MAG: hypothetical protein E5V57_26540, partial [Mesorhizobium sp.]